MNFDNAYKTMVRASVERNTIEVPALLSCLDFEGLNCLEIGPGPLARLSIKLSGFARHITLLEKRAEVILEVKNSVRMTGLARKISIAAYKGYEQGPFSFQDREFDVAYAAWLPHKTFTDPKFLDEVTRVAGKDILLLLPGMDGDEPELVSIVKPGEKERRRDYKKHITSYFKGKGYEVKTKYGLLKLDFKNKEEIRDVFYCMAFHGEELGDKKEQIDKFLDARTHNFADGFYILHAFR
ncbi:hypothetical protein A3K73_00735 [Candidatus Pacearchaeota archaeon RBG_13_36_9]|nr:MAG: hypothetical protein A3K73_00735 [Candidatus Pacearchaeota archaeon RBG_13_36_9]